LRILYWTQLFRPYIGGVEVHTTKFLPAMKKLGYEFCVVTSHGSLDLPDVDEYDSIPVHRFKFQSSLENKNVEEIFHNIKRLKEVKEQFKPDLVHINFTDPSIFFHFRTNNPSKVKTIVSFRLSVENNSYGTDSLLLQILENADWITASSKAVKDELIKLNPEVEEYTTVIYPSLEEPEIEAVPVSFSLPVLLCFGRVVNEKGFDLAIEAVYIISKKYPGIKLLIAGDGPAKDELIKKTKKLGIEQNVDFLGWINPDQIPDVINKSSVVIVPSRWKEAFGQVALQAMQLGRPVIAADSGGLKEIIDNNVNGILVEKENPAAIADAVTFLIENKEEALNLGINGRKTAREKFSWDKNINSFNNLYKYLGG
jgi:glycogen(starch) synthase